MGKLDLLSFGIEMGLLALVGLVYYLWQRNKILKNSDLDLYNDIKEYLLKSENEQYHLIFKDITISRENSAQLHSICADLLSDLPADLTSRWYKLFN